jgi:plasmid stabilization system protein ParE
MTLRFIHEARQELLDAIRYYEDAEAGLGRRFLFEIENTILLLGANPEIYRLRESHVRRVNLKSFPYYLPFIIRGDIVWILAVAHESRRPRYWISRRSSIV